MRTNFTLNRKTYYLDEELYNLIRKHGITRNEIENEKNKMQMMTPRVKITYNHAAYNVISRKIGRLL